MQKRHCYTCSCPQPPDVLSTFLATELIPATPTSAITTGETWLAYTRWMDNPANSQGQPILTQNQLTRTIRAYGYDIDQTSKGNVIWGFHLRNPSPRKQRQLPD